MTTGLKLGHFELYLSYVILMFLRSFYTFNSHPKTVPYPIAFSLPRLYCNFLDYKFFLKLLIVMSFLNSKAPRILFNYILTNQILKWVNIYIYIYNGQEFYTAT
jgi:hypothetical protein